MAKIIIDFSHPCRFCFGKASTRVNWVNACLAVLKHGFCYTKRGKVASGKVSLLCYADRNSGRSSLFSGCARPSREGRRDSYSVAHKFDCCGSGRQVGPDKYCTHRLACFAAGRHHEAFSGPSRSRLRQFSAMSAIQRPARIGQSSAAVLQDHRRRRPWGPKSHGGAWEPTQRAFRRYSMVETTFDRYNPAVLGVV